jgi:hypothetical protein
MKKSWFSNIRPWHVKSRSIQVRAWTIMPLHGSHGRNRMFIIVHIRKAPCLGSGSTEQATRTSGAIWARPGPQRAGAIAIRSRNLMRISPHNPPCCHRWSPGRQGSAPSRGSDGGGSDSPDPSAFSGGLVHKAHPCASARFMLSDSCAIRIRSADQR